MRVRDWLCNRKLTNKEEQNTKMERKMATIRMTPKTMNSCSSLANESSQITTLRGAETLHEMNRDK